jgi:hypothetical protein
MSMRRIDQSLGRGSGSSFRAWRKPVNVTGTVASQMITPTARTHDEDPLASAMRPAICSSGGTSRPGIVRTSVCGS